MWYGVVRGGLEYVEMVLSVRFILALPDLGTDTTGYQDTRIPGAAAGCSMTNATVIVYV